MTDAVILLEEIRKNYFMGRQELQVLKGISLDIQHNEYVALMGPSGSGKSTLMNILGCLDSPTSGSYILNGNDVSKMVDADLAEIRNKEIGFVFQQFNLLPRLTALENVALPLVYAGISKKMRTEMAMEVIRKVTCRTGVITDPMNFPGVSASVWPLPAHWSTILPSSLPMNQPVTSIPKRVTRS